MIICRVCLDNSEKLISLTSEDIDASSIVHMLNEFTIINAGQQLPNYICENCAGQLDIAYAFKRKYEDSTVKFIRQMTYREETEVAGGSSSNMTTHTDHPEDSSVDQKNNTDDMYKKPSPTLDNLPLGDDPERLNYDEVSSKSEHELAANFNTNPNRNGFDVHSIENYSSYGSVLKTLEGHETVQGQQCSITNQRNLIIQSVESLYLPNEFGNGKVDDGMPGLFNLNTCDTEPTHQPNKIEKENQLQTDQCGKEDRSPSSLPNLFPTVETNLKGAKRDWRVLRSTLRHSRLMNLEEVTLSSAVLNKIYTYHYGHGKKPFKCDVCCRWFKTKGHIKTHRVRHIEGQKRIKCSKCLLTFLTKPHFNNHRCCFKLT